MNNRIPDPSEITWDGYQAFCLSIWNEPNHNQRGLSIAGLGLVGEALELGEYVDMDYLGHTAEQAKHEVANEGGDVLYYTTILCDWKGIKVIDVIAGIDETDIHRIIQSHDFDVVPTRESLLNLACRCGNLSEKIKKYIRDGTDPDREEVERLCHNVLEALVNSLAYARVTLEECMTANVEKLIPRYAHVIESGKFSPDARAQR